MDYKPYGTANTVLIGLQLDISNEFTFEWFNGITSTSTVFSYPLQLSILYGIFTRTIRDTVGAAAGTAMVANITTSTCKVFVREAGNWSTYNFYAFIIGI